MSRERVGKKIKLNGYEDLFNSSEEQTEKEQIKELSLSELHTFKNHPFKIFDDEKMADLIESIKENGILVPLIVRKDNEGYEIIAGHRRKYACEKLGIEIVPAIIKELADDEATIMMVDSNIQREEILPSEKAFAYKMKLDAMKRQAGRPKNNVSQVGTEKRSDEILAEQTGESRNQIQRYIRLTYLIKELLDMTDIKKLPLNTSVELSFLSQEEQQMILNSIETYGIPSLKQAEKLKEYSKEGKLDENVVDAVMSSNNDKIKINLNHKTLSKYFPENYTKEQMEDVIIQFLEEWSKKNK